MKQTACFIIITLSLLSCSGETTNDPEPADSLTTGYPDTTREEHIEGPPGFTLYIRHDEHFREIQIFYDKDRMAMQQFLYDDQEDSVATWWYENGMIQTQREYKNGKLNGWDRSWKSDGTLHEESYYRNDTLIKGTQLYMDENFLVDYIEIIEDGKVVRIDSSQRGTEAYKLMEPPK